MKVQGDRVRHADVFVVIRIVFNLESFDFDLQFLHHSTSHVIHGEENTISGLVGTRMCLHKLKCTIVAILRLIQFV